MKNLYLHVIFSVFILFLLINIFSFRFNLDNTALVQNAKEANTVLPYPIVHSGLVKYFGDHREIGKTKIGDIFYGQDANYQKNFVSYSDNGDGTITDKITGLMWQKDMGQKMTYKEAEEKVKKLNLAGHSDWRIPTIKELFSLTDFNGEDGGISAGRRYFINTKYFNQPKGNTEIGEREIDAQTWSSTRYTGKTMGNNDTVFGFNFIDGRLKGYPVLDPRSKNERKMYFRFVRGNTEYGKNIFIDNLDGTISDLATGLLWQKEDSKKGMDWKSALSFCNNLKLVNKNDWRLPSVKELHSIVDYSRSPQSSNAASVDPVFKITKIKDVRGKDNYPSFWTATTFNYNGEAMYVSFGEALGKMFEQIQDVHGAGAVRSDPKSGAISDYPKYRGPQGDIQTVYNYVRCVRNIK